MTSSVSRSPWVASLQSTVAELVTELFNLLGTGNATFTAIRTLVSKVHELPHALLPPNIVDLAERLINSKTSWGAGRVLDKWVNCQAWRKKLPMPFEFHVGSDWEDSHGESKKILQQVLLPHEIVANFLAIGEVHRMIGREDLKKFWELESRATWYQQHPILSDPRTDLSCCIPMRIYGDGAESQRKQKFEILTIQFPLCSSSSTLQTRILCACINTVFSKTKAREKVLEVLAWSFQALSKGEYPSLDPWGNSFSEKHDPHRFRLAGTKISYFGILEGIQCDQDYLRILFNLQVGPSRQSCCHYCDAIQWVSNRAPFGPQNNPESLYTVFGPREGDATIIPPDQWQQLHGDSPLCRICGWAPERIFPDYTHIVHLALAMDSISSVLLDLTDPGIIDGASRDARLNHLWLSYREWAEGSRVPDRAAKRFFTTATLRPANGTKFCEVSQKIVSATACRYLIFWLCNLLRTTNTNDHLGTLRCGLIGGLASMESLLLRSGRWFSANSTAEFEKAYLCYRAALNQLAEHAGSVGELRYHMRPKIHMLGHIVYHFLPRNPKYYSCFLDEDFVYRVKNVAQVVHPLHTSRLAMQRYIIHVCMQWAGDGSTV